MLLSGIMTYVGQVFYVAKWHYDVLLLKYLSVKYT